MSKLYDPFEISAALGEPFPPTPEQAQVIAGPLGPKLVVAGAGAGKTKAMAARVVYQVANGLIRPEQVLGLTFTRKAAQQLEQRIRRQLQALRRSFLVVPGSPVAEALDNIAINVATYDSYAGDLVREYGLLLPVEPSTRIITEAEHYAIAHELVTGWTGELNAKSAVDTVVTTLLALSNSLDNEIKDPADVAEHERDFRLTVANLEKTRKNGPEYSKKMEDFLHKQKLRVQYLPLVAALRERKAELAVTTFGEQMAAAARLAARHPSVGASQRARYRVILLDEYQDTSHAQRVLLRSLYGNGYHEGLSVTAVGDPMQAIYGWRGATVENLAAFVEDFPQADGSAAPKDQMTISWRNPSRVLDLANDVAGAVFGAGPRPVDELSARPGAPEGEIKLAYFATQAEELDFMAGHLKEKYEAFLKGEDAEFSAAVLVRANSQSMAVAKALEAQGVPHEIVGLGGLLWEPEVQDLVALATLLIRPQDTAAALRILTGPLVGLGLEDIMALQARSRTLASRAGGGAEQASSRVRWHDGKDPLGHLREELDELMTEAPDQVPGLGDAVADLAEKDRYTPEGLARIRELAASLRHLRTYSLSKSLGDIFADIEARFNIRTEVLARGSAGGATHLDRFAEVVAGFAGGSLAAFLDYLHLAAEREDGLQPGEVPAGAERVQIMTAHKAKGLEFLHVCVVHADSASYAAKASTFLTVLEKVPGDDDVIDAGDAVKRSDFEKACKAFIEADRGHQAEEAARLFYVALTRTESSLVISGSGTNRRTGKAKKGPYEYLALLRDKHPELVAHWDVPLEPEEATAEQARVGLFPGLEPRPGAVAGAQLVRAAQEKLPELVEGERFSQWEREANALIEEWEALRAPTVEVELPSELTASDLVSLRNSPEDFARRQRRPVPFKPNAYAKRGTAFHSWLEQRFGGGALIGAEELPGIGEPVPAEELEQLREHFLASEWADRQPFRVEEPFEVTIGQAVVRGRMDAIFKRPLPDSGDGAGEGPGYEWIIVDWKTGQVPCGKELDDAVVQLAVYAEAWRRLCPDPQSEAPVRAAFHYVVPNYTLEPQHLPGASELAALLEVEA